MKQLKRDNSSKNRDIGPKLPDFKPELLTACLLCAVMALTLAIIRQSIHFTGWFAGTGGDLFILFLLGVALVTGGAGICGGKRR